MGQFSWLTIDTEEQVFNDYDKEVYYLLAPGKKWEEPDYEGYGVFGGKDAYQLVAELNCPEKCNGDVDHDRSIGIAIACYDEDHEKLEFPIRITTDPNAKYEDFKGFSKGDPNQGWHCEEEYYECSVCGCEVGQGEDICLHCELNQEEEDEESDDEWE